MRFINKPTGAVIAFEFDKKDAEQNLLIFDLGGLATVTVAEVGVIIFDELMNLLFHGTIHQHIHQRNIARVLLPILIIIIAPGVTVALVIVAVVAVIIEALMNLKINMTKTNKFIIKF